MRLLILAPALALLVLGASSALPAAAAPEHNKNATTFDVSCEGLGDFEVTSVENASAAFDPDGRVLVAKHIEGTFAGSLAVQGGPTINFPPEEFEEGSNGRGFRDRLISCDFTDTFSDTFKLTAEDVAFFELDESFIGADATFTGTNSGTAEVIVPGNK